MTELIFKQFDLTRNKFLQEIEAISAETLDKQPEGFNNTIHWHIGHVLTLGEQFMFGENFSLPANYKELFGGGTKPADWKGEVPSVAELAEQLKSQLARIKEIPVSRLSEPLKKPFKIYETLGDLANLTLYHEALHLGEIHAMKMVIEK